MRGEPCRLVTTITPNYYGEINEIIGNYSAAQITQFDGFNFTVTNADPLQTGIHTGSMHLVLTETVNTRVDFIATWPGEGYSATVSDNLYQSSDLLQINMNNLRLQIRYVCVITWP